MGTPETALWSEVFNTAVEDIRIKLPDKIPETKDEIRRFNDLQRLIRNAKDWFRSDDYWVGSFVFCCDILGVDKGIIRKELGVI